MWCEGQGGQEDGGRGVQPVKGGMAAILHIQRRLFCLPVVSVTIRGLELSLKSMLYLGKGARGGHLANTKTTFLPEVSVTIWCLERSLNFKDRFFKV